LRIKFLFSNFRKWVEYYAQKKADPLINEMMNFGFTRDKAMRALERNDFNSDKAMQWLAEGNDD